MTLTERERDVLELHARGLDRQQAATRLYVSPRTVDFHTANARAKMGVESTHAAYLEAVRQGLLTCPCGIGHQDRRERDNAVAAEGLAAIERQLAALAIECARLRGRLQ